MFVAKFVKSIEDDEFVVDSSSIYDAERVSLFLCLLSMCLFRDPGFLQGLLHSKHRNKTESSTLVAC